MYFFTLISIQFLQHFLCGYTVCQCFLNKIPSLYEPRHEKTNNLQTRKQRHRSAKLISAFVFTTWILQFFFLLNLKFPASSIFCARTARFVLSLFGNNIVGFHMTLLMSLQSQNEADFFLKDNKDTYIFCLTAFRF